MDKLKVVSLNIRGMGDGVKRRKIFCYLKRFNGDVCMLQEVHGSQETNQQWEHENGNRIIYSNGDSKSRGIAIVLGKKIGKIEEIRRDMEGRYIMLKTIIGNYSYCIANL